MTVISIRCAALALLASLFVASTAIAGQATAYVYDTLGRISTVTYPNGVIVTYTYDKASNRTKRVVS